MRTSPTKVLYIAGWGRSGSTLLGNVLGQMDCFFHVGELRHIWDRSLTENRPYFVERPAATVKRILELVAETPSGTPFRTDRLVELDIQYTVAGNPVRFREGSILIEADEE